MLRLLIKEMLMFSFQFLLSVLAFLPVKLIKCSGHKFLACKKLTNSLNVCVLEMFKSLGFHAQIEQPKEWLLNMNRKLTQTSTKKRS